ncbi:hypothetical protein GCM10027082_17620 [Comamonas humi]
MKIHLPKVTFCLTAALALAACSPSPGISYPDDAQIAAALDQQLATDPNSAAALALIRTLGGEQGKLRYQIKRVVYRQGAYEVHYDAALHMGQAGTDSLKALYASMIPEAERGKLSPDALETYEGWLKQHAETLQKDAAHRGEGQVLANTVALLDQCYRRVKPGEEIPVLQTLGALLSPERKGLYAEKIVLPGTTVRCLPL